MQVTLVFQILGYNATIALGAEVGKDDDELEEKEIQIIESSGIVERALIGFQPNDDEEDEDRYRG